MSSYKTQQHHLVRQGRSFHFVSYEEHPADVKRQQPEMPAGWYLMLAGKRWMVMPEVGETVPAELEHQFAEWLEAHVFSGAPAVQSQQPPFVGAATSSSGTAPYRAETTALADVLESGWRSA
jgi:hypothetical protein